MTYTALLATVYYAVKSVVDPTILPNAGLARPLTVTAQAGTVLNCVHPAAVNGRVQTCQRVSDMILGALAQVVPNRVTACSNSACSVATFVGQRAKDHTIWVYLETMGGGAGARPNKDGLDGVLVHTTNTSNLPVEALEVEYPLTLIRYELVNGSGGPGKFRGGMGLRRVYRADAECRVQLDLSRLRSVSWGLSGGLPGNSSRVVCGPGVVLERDNATVQPGQWFEIITPGAGGYGPPAERDRIAIARDIAEGIIDAEDAHNIYGFTR
jgi:N-methylhydantoinase B